ncbi:MAG: hypothetical protein IJU92_06125, partial [Spirochaetaceae bacterium]|nr:hypothetical protein [Spirochaetaceae bacterium]
MKFSIFSYYLSSNLCVFFKKKKVMIRKYCFLLFVPSVVTAGDREKETSVGLSVGLAFHKLKEPRLGGEVMVEPEPEP